MSNFIEPTENDNTDCHLQQIGMGTLVCRAARQIGDGTTNEVDEKICFNCEAGKIFREVGCDAVLPKLTIRAYIGGHAMALESLLCKIRKKPTTLDYCSSCGLATAETTRQIITTARGLFQAQGFYSAYTDIEKAREAIRDGNFENAITRSIACLESVIRTCHESLGCPLPSKKQLTDLWKSMREILQFDQIDSSGSLRDLLNSLAGAMSHLGGLRNALGDAHGKGTHPPEVSEVIAEIAINTASTLATAIIRRHNQIKGKSDD
jgi:hypothetical protein